MNRAGILVCSFGAFAFGCSEPPGSSETSTTSTTTITNDASDATAVDDAPPNPTGEPTTDAPTSSDASTDGSGAGESTAVTDEPSGGDSTTGLPAEAFFFDDFEADAVGATPGEWNTFLGYAVNGPNPGDNGSLALVDDSDAHGGAHAVHVHGGSSAALITRALPPATDRLYVRAYVKLSRPLGANPTSNNHETLIGIRATPGDGNNEVRFGEIKGAIGTNEVPSDDIAPPYAAWGLGAQVPANTWACFEVAFLADLPYHELHAWVDGELVHSVTTLDDWDHRALPATWMQGKFTEVLLGWQSFSSNTVDLWIDDVVLSTAPIGCP